MRDRELIIVDPIDMSEQSIMISDAPLNIIHAIIERRFCACGPNCTLPERAKIELIIRKIDGRL